MKERKYIVFQSCLLSLFSVCMICFGKCTNTIKTMGAYIQVTSVCHYGHLRDWSSGPVHEKMPVANLCISAGLLFSGCSPVKLLNFFKHINIAGITLRSYFRMQKHYLIPAVKLIWNIKQTSLLAERKGKAVRLAGDGRCCSPGHTAKYGSYTLMDADTGEILAMELVQVDIQLMLLCHVTQASFVVFIYKL
jgi:solute carrier family 8 (sodium/calcium exchanger)